MSAATRSTELPGFTDGLNRLFETYRWRGEDGALRAYTTPTLSAALRELGYQYSDSYIHQLRTGSKANPSAVLIAGLSKAFGGIDVRYWYDLEVRIQMLRDLDREMEELRRL